MAAHLATCIRTSERIGMATPRLLVFFSLLTVFAGALAAQPTQPAGAPGGAAATTPTAPANAAPAATTPAPTAPAPPAATTPTTPPAQPTRPAAEPAPARVVSPGPSSSAERRPLVQFLFFSWTGWILIFCYIAFVTLLVLMILDLRAGRLMPLDLVDQVEDALNKRRYKEALERSKEDESLFGVVMAAGISRLQYGLEEARDAAAAMLENLKARKDALLSYLAILGTLGPLIGLVGTVAGMIATFAELGHGGTPRYDRLALGISHALNATLVGIFLSVLAIPAYSYFKNRLLRLILDADLLADDLLTQAFYLSKKETPPVGSGAQASLPPKP
jgi:biopolymer transport protein ExbB